MVKFIKRLLPIQEDEPQWVITLFSEISESSDTGSTVDLLFLKPNCVLAKCPSIMSESIF